MDNITPIFDFKGEIKHPYTITFCKMTPAHFASIDVIYGLLRSILNWPRGDVWFLREVAARLVAVDSFRLKHEDFGAEIYLNGTLSTVKSGVSRRVKKIIAAMDNSRFQPIWIHTDQREEYLPGRWRMLPALYKRGCLWPFIEDVKREVWLCDLFALPARNQKPRLKAIIKAWLDAHGAVPLERKLKDEEAEKAARVKKLSRKPNESFDQFLEQTYEQLRLYLCEPGEINKEFRERVRRFSNIGEAAEIYAHELITRTNKKGF
jgi:hypothetical protein